MQIKSIEIQGYRGISQDTSLVINELGHRNILIGPNNSGKSIPFRFLHFISKHLIDSEERRTQLYHTISADSNLDDSFWWQHDSSSPIRSTIQMNGLPLHNSQSTYAEFVDIGNSWQIEIDIYRQSNASYMILIAPMIFENDEWKSILEYHGGSGNPKNLNNNGQFISSDTISDCPYLQSGFDIIRLWAKQLRFFDPVRATDRNMGIRGMDDGSRLLVDLHDLQLNTNRVREHHDFIEQLKDDINDLLTPSGVSPITQISARGDRDSPQLTITQQDSKPVALENMGTGIAELVILLTSLIQNAETPALYFIEEPETHLHPGLFRRLMTKLGQNLSIQFFITSHSSVVLDTLTDLDCVYHFYQRNDGACLCHLAKEVTQQHKLLDSLGVSASALLQTNCVIWIEGPSDRLYLRHWIKLVDAGLEEGSDYAFVFYGGKILSHFSLEANDAIYDDLLPMINIGRFSAVMMDRDLPPSDDAIRETKQRICDEAAHDADHRRAYITINREVENDVPQDVLIKAIQEIIGDSSLNLEGLDFVQNETYTKEVITHLNLDDEKRIKTIEGKISNKINLSRKVLGILEQDNRQESPEYINNLCDFIRSSQNLEA